MPRGEDILLYNIGTLYLLTKYIPTSLKVLKTNYRLSLFELIRVNQKG